MKGLYGIALALVVVGAINWGLIGFLNFNLVAAIFGDESFLSRVIYSLVGVSALIVAARALTPAIEPTPVAARN